MSSSVGTNGMADGQQQFVPLWVFAQAQREQADTMRRIEGKVDRVVERVQELAIAVASEDAAGIATEAATEGIERARRSRSERMWEVVKMVLAAVLTLVGTLIVWWLTN